MARLIHRALATAAGPLIEAHLRRRLAAGKEDPDRFGERFGRPGRERPDGPLVWIHAASNGEAMSALPLIDRLLARDPAGAVLITTGTVTSAQLMARRLPERAVHQYVPVDRPVWVSAFLDHWRPDVGIWVESEFWPSLIWGMRDAGRPMALVNGRVSERSLARWRRIPGIAGDLLAGFDPCLAQGEVEAERLRQLGAKDATFVGNLKLSASALPVSPESLDALAAEIAGRPVWVAASTHPGEEDVVAEAHAAIKADVPAVLTILAPRHPGRGEAIARSLREKGLVVARRSLGEFAGPATDILLADTLGELGLFYTVSPVAFVGGSLRGQHGGHNPVEPALLGAAPLFGPDMANFGAIAAAMESAGGARVVRDAPDLARRVVSLLSNDPERAAMAEAARRVAEDGADAVERVMARLESVLPPIRGACGGPKS
jgi:3-deoxy-D-manno-octulosonic-acid transferase